MTYDEKADAAFIYLSDPIEPGGEASSSILNKDLDQAAVVASFDKEARLIGNRAAWRVSTPASRCDTAD